MLPPDRPSLNLSESHRRGIAATLGLLDEMLCLIDDWAAGRERRGVLYQERNNLSPAQRETLLERTASLRKRLDTARRELALPVRSCDALTDIWSRCGAARETIMELEGRHLRRYGRLTPEQERYMDALSSEVLEGVDGLLAALEEKRGP